MGREYWLRRSSVAAMMAREATDAEARLIQYELAGRNSPRPWGSPTRATPWPGAADGRGA